MKKLGGILGVIIGAVVLLSACDKPRGAMAFESLDPSHSSRRCRVVSRSRAKGSGI